MSIKRETMVIVPTGVGRKDWSQSVEYSVEQQIRSLQLRFFYSVRYIGSLIDGICLPITYPNVYESPLAFLVNGVLQNTAPTTKPWVFYLVEASSDRNALVVVALNRYNSYADYLASTPAAPRIAEHLGTAFGYGIATLVFTKGIPTIPGSVYSIQYGELSGLLFNMDVTVHGLVGGQEEVE